MSQPPDWLPEDVDLVKPSAARCYDYYLGGAHNFAVDRELAEQVLAQVPYGRDVARDNRAFLRRAVRYCVDNGVRQFLDIGSGIPTVGNVHEVAQAVDPDCRVVYVDNEPVAVAHSQTILEGNDNAAALRADFADVDAILEHAETRRLLDFSRPVGLMLIALAHFVPDAERPHEIVRRYADRLAPGSYLALSHLTDDDYPDKVHGPRESYKASSNPFHPRSRAQVAELTTDFELVDPGLVHLPQWRPDADEDRWENPETSLLYAAVGRKV